MNRNMLSRVELAWPVLDKSCASVIDECLVAYLGDDRDAWTLDASGAYQKPERPLEGKGAQQALMVRYGGKSL
jgi:polyphosphate kinase